MTYGLILIPLISAFIGWFTNWIAIKMLFHPKAPKKMLGITIQGIFPKRQQQFAEKLGKLVSNELLSFQDIRNKMTDPNQVQHIMPVVETHMDHFLRHKLATEIPMIGMLIGERTIAQLKTVFMVELETLFPAILQAYMKNMEQELNLEKIVSEKVSQFSSDKLEEVLKGIMAKEFRFVEILGGVLGFLIGLVQVLISLLG